MPRWFGRLVMLLLGLSGATAFAQPLVNSSFEDGIERPAGWSLVGTGGRLLDDSADGKRSIAITGDGKGSSYWRSDAIDFAPGAVYRLAFSAKSIDARGGTPITGPAFCNRDLGALSNNWQRFESIFATPATIPPGESYLRFGQWEMRGTVAFDAVELCRAIPVYARRGDLVLGEGESIQGNQYGFTAPFHGQSRNHSRALARHTCGYNSDRWVFGRDSEVVYRHAIADRQQQGGEVQVSVTWYNSGALAVEASRDGSTWQPLGTLRGLSAQKFSIPPELLPAGQVWVRLRGVADEKGKSASLQVSQYAYSATLAGPPITVAGETRFVVIKANDPRFDVTIDSLGDGLPGGRNEFRGSIHARIDKPVDVEFIAHVGREIDPHSLVGEGGVSWTKQAIHPGQQSFALSYDVLGSGDNALCMTIRQGQHVLFEASTSIRVADLHASGFGRLLPSTTESAQVWWASSGWKISRTRPVPQAKSDALLIRAARNETEAAQLVIRPTKPITGLTARADALSGPNGATIAPDRIELLRVRYLNITHPTDSTGTAAPWPDPLPPLAAPIDIPANENQPLWVRVNVPRDTKPGIYNGTIRLSAKDYVATVPLRVEVYDFILPDRMTCVTSFGFSPDEAWRYQKVKDPADRRVVLDKYLSNLSQHHISPYHPAPMDRLKVTWDKKTLTPTFDFTAWDAGMAKAIDQYHFNSFMVEIPGMGGGTFHHRVDPELLGYKENMPQYKTAFESYCRQIEEHLRSRGWLEEAYIYWFDEPDKKDYAFVNNGFKKLKQAAPGINRMLTEQVEPELVGGPNIWCPLTPEYKHNLAEERRKAGDKFWWYVCCGPKAPYATLFIDHPATEMRVWLWQTWQRKIDGILIWQMNYWNSTTAYPDPKRPQNPYEDPMSWCSGYGVAKGAKQPWGNGDGRFIYPPEVAADASAGPTVLDGPVDSIRWEMLRDGIEDYEYLVMLRRLLAEKGGKLAPEKRAEYESLLLVPPEITRDLTTFTKDPAPIESRRHEIAKAIEILSR